MFFGTSLHTYRTSITHFIVHDHQLPAASSDIISFLDIVILTGG